VSLRGTKSINRSATIQQIEGEGERSEAATEVDGLLGDGVCEVTTAGLGVVEDLRKGIRIGSRWSSPDHPHRLRRGRDWPLGRRGDGDARGGEDKERLTPRPSSKVGMEEGHRSGVYYTARPTSANQRSGAVRALLHING
jgi:hypothetical protein